MELHHDRRRFLRRLSAVAWAAPLAASRRRLSANETIGIAIIGVGGLGGNHHFNALRSRRAFRLLAVCDADRRHMERCASRFDGKLDLVDDYRRLLDRKDLDAVLIATPDHWHALPAIHACEAGKDVYCEKPLSLTIAEGREMVNAARRYGRVFQTGTQQRSGARFRQACSLVRNGKIGKLRSITCVLGEGPRAERLPDGPPPAGLDWDRWLGPAPAVPYNRARGHYTFRWFYDTSGGKMTDWGAHHLDIAQWALGTELSGPIAIEGSGVHPANNAYETPVSFDVRYRYANGVTVRALASGENGITFEGSEGTLFVSRSTIRSSVDGILDLDFDGLPIQLRRSSNHHDDFAECVRTRRRPISDVEIGHRSATVCHLGNIAIRLGRPISWDPERERCDDDPAAQRLVAKPRRHPWRLR